MKIPVIILSSLLIALHAGAEMRTFTCPDGERTFNGRLTAFNSDTETVSVISEDGRSMHFNIDLISEKDQEWVRKIAPALPANVSLEVRFDQIRERQSAERDGRSRRNTYDAGYSITISDFSGQGIKNAEVEYLLIYRKDDTDSSGENITVSGSESISVEPNASVEIDTNTVQLVSFVSRGGVSVSGGGCRGGSCGASATATRTQRSRDFLVGCIAQVKINGVVVETAATAPNIMRNYEEQLGGRTAARDY